MQSQGVTGILDNLARWHLSYTEHIYLSPSKLCFLKAPNLHRTAFNIRGFLKVSRILQSWLFVGETVNSRKLYVQAYNMGNCSCQGVSKSELIYDRYISM